MRTYLIGLTFLFCCSAYAQFTLSNQRSLGGSGYEEFVYNTVDGNNATLLVGSSDSPVSGMKTALPKGGLDIWLVNVDEDNNYQWDKAIGGSADDFAYDFWNDETFIYIVSMSQSGISGDKTMSSFGMTDTWMLCLDMNGNIVWQQQLGGSGEERQPRVIEHSDTSLLVVSESSSPISGNKTVANVGGSDIWIVEVSKTTGQIIQQRTIGSPSGELTPTIHRSATSGNYILRSTSFMGTGGDKTDAGYGDTDLWIVEIDENLNVLTDKCFGGNTADRNSLAFFDDGTHYYFSGVSYSGASGNKTSGNFGDEDFWLLKTDHNLNLTWDKSYGGTAAEAGSVLHRNANGRFVFSGTSASMAGTGNKTAPKYGGNDCWLLVLDENGEIIAQETFGGTLDDQGFVLRKAGSETALTLMLRSDSPVSGNKTVSTWGGNDEWIATIDASTYLNIAPLPESPVVGVYPNPFTDKITFALQALNEDVTIRIFTIDGREIARMLVPMLTEAVEWQPETLPESILLYELSGRTVQVSGRLIRQ